MFDLGNHYLQVNNQKMITSGSIPSLPSAVGPMSVLNTTEIKAVKSMPAEAIIGCWKETVRELGNILVQVAIKR